MERGHLEYDDIFVAYMLLLKSRGAACSLTLPLGLELGDPGA